MKTVIALFVALAGFALPASSQNMLRRANAANAIWRAQQGYGPAGTGYGYYNGGGYGYYNRGVRPAVAAAIGYAAGAGTVLAVQAAMHRGGHPLAGPGNNSRNGSGGEFTLTNQTRFSIEVWFGKGKGKYLDRLAPGESWQVKGPKPGERYSGFALIPAANGGLSSDEVPIQPTQSGWTFVEPDCVRQGGN